VDLCGFFYGFGLDLVGFQRYYGSLWFWFGSGMFLMLNLCVFGSGRI